VPERSAADVRNYRYALALFACLPFAAWGQGFIRVVWQHGGVDVTEFRLYAGRTPETLVDMARYSAEWREGSIDGLPYGTWYAAVSAMNSGVESPRSRVLRCEVSSTPRTCDPPLEVPGPVRNLAVTVVPPPTGVSVTLRTVRSDYFLLDLTGTQLVEIRAVPSATLFDYALSNTGARLVVSPDIGWNNDGIAANAIRIRGPITGAQLELDPDPTGFIAVVNGVVRPLVRNGSTWSVTF
jgi:hypothetical protein